MTPQETDPDLTVSVQACLVEARACLGPFEGDHHYLHYLHHSFPASQQQGGNTKSINRKLD